MLLLHDFQGDIYHNDIALFEFDMPVEMTDMVMPICLEREPFINGLLAGSARGVVTGCGALYEGQDPAYPDKLNEVRFFFQHYHEIRFSHGNVHRMIHGFCHVLRVL